MPFFVPPGNTINTGSVMFLGDIESDQQCLVSFLWFSVQEQTTFLAVAFFATT